MYGSIGAGDILVAFIAVVILVVMVDQMTKIIKEILPFPPKVESVITYLILCGIASVICWQGDFDLFRYLHFNWQYQWEGWVLTGALIAGGTALLAKLFGTIRTIPSPISGMTSMFGYGGGYSADETPITESEGSENTSEYHV